jgi:hypothetical protein
MGCCLSNKKIKMGYEKYSQQQTSKEKFKNDTVGKPKLVVNRRI